VTPAPTHDLIALIGPRGSGKTTVARLLARALGWQSMDADELLEARAGRCVRDIFAAEGEVAFRQHESAVLRELCQMPRHVIATGGGIILREENRILLRSSARVVWLTADADTLWQRLAADPVSARLRPPLSVGGRAEVVEVLRVREPLYRACAHYTVTTTGKSPTEVVAEIAAVCSDLHRVPQTSQD
jgi:shikimate kinase